MIREKSKKSIATIEVNKSEKNTEEISIGSTNQTNDIDNNDIYGGTF